MGRDFQSLLSSFFLEYLPHRRSFSAHTIRGYRDSFVIFLRWLDTENEVSPNRVEVPFLTADRIESFLTWLCLEKQCREATSNIRLAALKAFARFVQYECPEHINVCSAILAIRPKRTPQKEMRYLSVKAVSLLLASARAIPRDYAMLSLLYDSGARVTELASLRICDVCLDAPRTVRLFGKGSKVRIVPISKQVADIVSSYLDGQCAKRERNSDLFLSNRNEAIGRAGIAYVLNKHATTAHALYPDVVPARINPHMLRHSKAMHMLEAGINLVYIRDFLGHSSVTTTEVYARANPEMKRKAIEEASANIIKKSRYNKKDRNDLVHWLQENI